MGPYFIGIDIGTQGARVVLIDAEGNIASAAEEIFPLNSKSRDEQSPLVWWDICSTLLKRLLTTANIDRYKDILAITVTSTSGTVIPLDAAHQPLHDAIMYSNQCAIKQAEESTAAALKYYNKGYTTFNFSSGLAKMVWFGETYPDKAKKIANWIHAADFITGKLTNIWGITDYTNALKSGYDIDTYEWPDYLYTKLPLRKEWLPEVVPSGTVIGKISNQIALELGLPNTVQVTVGITDGCASQVASGAINLGDWNTTIGTTMVIKGVTEKEVLDSSGSIYNHRHPDGYWMPGGASNTGADWVTNEFGDDLMDLNRQAHAHIPTGFIAYPLRQHGERFPFISPIARGFEPSGLTKIERFVANMEGVAYIERYAYELITFLSKENVNAIYTAGAGSNSDAWLTIRSNVLNKPIYKMRHISGAVGAAIVAASKTYFNTLVEAVKNLTQVDKRVDPQQDLVEKYETNYNKFLGTMKNKGYINA